VDWIHTQGQPAAPPATHAESAELSFYVVFTTPRETLAALREATALAQGLNARITVLAASEVTFPLPLYEPPVPVQFMEDRMRTLVESSETDASVEVHLCRDRREAVLRALPPASLVVMGGRKRWWAGGARALAKSLARDGHKVIFVEDIPGI